MLVGLLVFAIAGLIVACGFSACGWRICVGALWCWVWGAVGSLHLVGWDYVSFGYVGFDCSFLFVSLCLLWYCVLVLSGIWLLIWGVSFVLLVGCLLLVGWPLCLDAVVGCCGWVLLIVLYYRFLWYGFV